MNTVSELVNLFADFDLSSFKVELPAESFFAGYTGLTLQEQTVVNGLFFYYTSRHLPTIDVDPASSLIATQPSVFDDFAEVGERRRHDLPFVIRWNATLYLRDGHHRCAAAASRHETIRVRLLDEPFKGGYAKAPHDQTGARLRDSMAPLFVFGPAIGLVARGLLEAKREGQLELVSIDVAAKAAGFASGEHLSELAVAS